jgi:GMP synthase-like glutamine amidotransferase
MKNTNVFNVIIILMDDDITYINKLMTQFNYSFNKVNEKINNNDGIYVQLHYIKYNTMNIIDIIKDYKSQFKYNVIILSGSTKRVLQDGSHDLPKNILRLKIPVLALCYGYEWIVKVLGGKVATFENNKEHVYNKFIEFKKPFTVSKQKYHFYHHDYIKELPSGGNNNEWVALCVHDDQIWAAHNEKLQIMCLQFHPEFHKKSGIEFYSKFIAWLKEKI